MKNHTYILLLVLYLIAYQNGTCQKLTITSGSKWVMQGNASLVMMNGALINNGNIISNDNSSLYFRGSDSSSLQGSQAISIKNLYVDHLTTKPLNIYTTVNIFNALNLSYGTSIVKTNDLLTLKSTASGNARIGSIPNGGNIIGKVTIENYIPARRAYRLLGVPINATNAPTIKESWQENATSVSDNPNPGYGTHITGPLSPSNGFDYNAQHSVSCKTFTGTSWLTVPNTDVTKITDYPGYILFIRGSRANDLAAGTYATADNTTLRIKGNLNIGDIQYNINATGLTMISNPYASPINFASITKSQHVIKSFYVWDPLLTGSKGSGGYVTVSFNGIDYDVTSCVTTTDQYIQSGSAFFMKTDGNAGNITIKETDKTTEAHLRNRPAVSTSKLSADLYDVNADKSLILFDGIVVGFNDIYSNNVDEYDATKLNSGAESMGIVRDGQTLSIERRRPPLLNMDDTIFITLSALSIGNHLLVFRPSNINFTSHTAYIADSYTGNITPISLSNNSSVPFTVTSDPATSKSDRFILMMKHNEVLAVQKIDLSASKTNNDILLTFSITDNNNLQHIDIEKSKDGMQFEKIGFVSPINENGWYTFLDQHPENEKLYYRIKVHKTSGEYKYSNICSINAANKLTGFDIYPNIITDNSVQLQTAQMPAGSYSVMVRNNIGQKVFYTTLNHQGGSCARNIDINYPLPPGIYYVEITSPQKDNTVIKIVKK